MSESFERITEVITGIGIAIRVRKFPDGSAILGFDTSKSNEATSTVESSFPISAEDIATLIHVLALPPTKTIEDF